MKLDQTYCFCCPWNDQNLHHDQCQSYSCLLFDHFSDGHLWYNLGFGNPGRSNWISLDRRTPPGPRLHGFGLFRNYFWASFVYFDLDHLNKAWLNYTTYTVKQTNKQKLGLISYQHLWFSPLSSHIVLLFAKTFFNHFLYTAKTLLKTILSM